MSPLLEVPTHTQPQTAVTAGLKGCNSFNVASQPTKHIIVQLLAKASTKTKVRNQNVQTFHFQQHFRLF